MTKQCDECGGFLTTEGECHKTHAEEVNELKDKTLEEVKSKAMKQKPYVEDLSSHTVHVKLSKSHSKSI